MRLKTLCLTINLLLVPACKDVNEPQFTWCVMANFEQMHCFDKDNKETVHSIEDGLGYIMMSPEDVGKLRDHHQELHNELDLCE